MLKFLDAKQDDTNKVKWQGDKLVINGVSFSAKDDVLDYSDVNLIPGIDVKHSEHFVEDGSTFMAHSAIVNSKDEVTRAMASIMQDKSIAGATHNIYICMHIAYAQTTTPQNAKNYDGSMELLVSF